ncbi:lipopolysaccharide assembly protein LapB [Streptomyces sp. Ag109_O5-1]|uniref:tetratricopeptide repeat protein n=1 Tax=Streptomyces sp. Ag109_O5-1 TaxID=1938851 RepID=UPI000F4E1259|nr:tetratricopeptide repeat protein [Streptomyces sp. Ag109_O5-1]
MGNLDARIEGLTSQATRGRLTADGWGELVELTALRGHVRGRIDETERAASLAETFVDQAPRDPRSLLARARLRGLFHRFAAALDDLDAAAALGLDRRTVDEERAAVCQTVGRYDEALALLRQGLSRRQDFRTLGAMARCHAESGEADEAETWFLAARRAYRGVSPFPLAVLEFQCGQMRLAQGRLVSARTWLESAASRLPSYVPTQGRLAETDAAEGRMAVAIERLRRLALISDDPDYTSRLARLLCQSEASAEARFWRAHAGARYEELMARHPEAYADHAAEFWLTVGGDPQRALRLARHNLVLRATPRAHALVDRAMRRVGQCRR